MFGTEFSRKVSLSTDDSQGRIQYLRHLVVCSAWCELFAVWQHRYINESGMEMVNESVPGTISQIPKEAFVYIYYI